MMAHHFEWWYCSAYTIRIYFTKSELTFIHPVILYHIGSNTQKYGNTAYYWLSLKSRYWIFTSNCINDEKLRKKRRRICHPICYSTHFSIHPCIHRSIHSFIHLSIHPSFHPIWIVWSKLCCIEESVLANSIWLLSIRLVLMLFPARLCV